MSLQKSLFTFIIALYLSFFTQQTMSWKPDVTFTKISDSTHLHDIQHTTFASFQNLNQQATGNFQFTSAAISSTTIESGEEVDVRFTVQQIDYDTALRRHGFKLRFKHGIHRRSPYEPEVTVSLFQIHHREHRLREGNLFPIPTDVISNFHIQLSPRRPIYAFKGLVLKKRRVKEFQQYSLKFRLPLFLKSGRYTVVLALSEFDDPRVMLNGDVVESDRRFNQRYLLPVNSFWYHQVQAEFTIGSVATESTSSVEAADAANSMVSRFFNWFNPSTGKKNENITPTADNTPDQSIPPPTSIPHYIPPDVLRQIFDQIDDPIGVCGFCQSSRSTTTLCDPVFTHGSLNDQRYFSSSAEFCSHIGIEKSIQQLEAKFISLYALVKSPSGTSFTSLISSREMYVETMNSRIFNIGEKILQNYPCVDPQIIRFLDQPPTTLRGVEVLVRYIVKTIDGLEFKVKCLDEAAKKHFGSKRSRLYESNFPAKSYPCSRASNNHHFISFIIGRQWLVAESDTFNPTNTVQFSLKKRRKSSLGY